MPWKYQTLHCLIINKTWLHRTSSIWVFEDSQIPKWVFFFELVKITQIIPFIQNWLYLRIFFIQHLFEPYVELLTIFSWILNYCRAINFYRRETVTIYIKVMFKVGSKMANKELPNFFFDPPKNKKPSVQKVPPYKINGDI